MVWGSGSLRFMCCCIGCRQDPERHSCRWVSWQCWCTYQVLLFQVLWSQVPSVSCRRRLLPASHTHIHSCRCHMDGHLMQMHAHTRSQHPPVRPPRSVCCVQRGCALQWPACAHNGCRWQPLTAPQSRSRTPAATTGELWRQQVSSSNNR